jgi:hypothetical protein
MYDLHQLGWNGFQQLCSTVAREVLGQTVESYLDTNDAGKDGAFAGHWNPSGQESVNGKFVIQCKFTCKANLNLRPSDLADEVTKAQRLVDKGQCDAYVLMTNAGISGRSSIAIERLFERAGAKHVLLFGSTWITQQIRENKRLRMLVPRLYGLGDLSQILDERAYAQARAVLESLRDDLARVVVTDAYRKAVSALDSHGFVLLIGEPAAGKTTIASLLAMAAVDQWNSAVLKLDDPTKVIEHWNPDEPSQFFWLDDAFGVTQYESFLVHGWNHMLPQIKSMLRNGAKIVMTSRDYIYNRARRELKESAFPLLNESQVVIDVHNLSTEEKRQILYNHLKLGNQPATFRTAIKPFLESIAAQSRFVPETARRMSDSTFTKSLTLREYHLHEFVNKREQFLQEVLQGLDGDSKAALALIYMRNDRLESPIELNASERNAIARLGSNLGGCTSALESLNGSLVLHTHASGSSNWRFKHPTIGDAYASILSRSPELLGIFVFGSAPEKLVELVTCGDAGIENAVIIPSSLYPDMLTKLGEFVTTSKYKTDFLANWGAESSVTRFLARRCSREFLKMYVAENPSILDKVSAPRQYLSAVAEVDLAIRLHELGILPEVNRLAFVDAVSNYAVQGEDMYVLEDFGVKSVFTEEEFTQLLHEVRSKLVPRLEEVRTEFQSNHDYGESPDSYIQPLLDSFGALKSHFAEDEQIAAIIQRETLLLTEWAQEHDYEESSREPRSLGNVEAEHHPVSSRSIFDDIDV